MLLYPILLVVVIAAADSGLSLAPDAPGLAALVAALLPPATIVALSAGAVRLLRRRLAQGSAEAARTAHRLSTLAQWTLLVNHMAAVLLFGWPGVVREAIGDLVLVDEIICIAPPIIGLLGVWWVHYPIEKALRDAVAVHLFERGEAVYPVPARGEWVMHQARSGLLLMLVPVLMIVGCSELIARADAPWAAWWVRDLARLAAVGAIFITWPLMARLVLGVRPMAPGELRSALLEICSRHGVRVRDIMVWETGGVIINAAVMGLWSRLRYVLMTDGLLDSLSRPQLLAVMAHEVAHVRRRHIPWLIICCVAVVATSVAAVELPIRVLESAGLLEEVLRLPRWMEMALVAGQMGLCLVAFGWVSRRFERQADAFAAQHLSGLGVPGTSGRVEPEAVAAMRDALERIAELNTIDRRRPSWRHGSIAWRQEYLASIVGEPLAALSIDRRVRAIKLLAAVVAAAAISLEVAIAATSGEDEWAPEAPEMERRAGPE